MQLCLSSPSLLAHSTVIHKFQPLPPLTSQQAMYQMLDEHFVGLIFSVFNSEASSKAGRVQVGLGTSSRIMKM